MDRRSWLWRRKSSEKSPGETESSGSVSSHSERYSEDQEALRVSSVNASPNYAPSPEVSSKPTDYDPIETIKSLNEKLSAALLSINAKEELVKQHVKVAEEAVSGWEKAEADVAALKQQLEVALQKNSALEDRTNHLDGALKECVRQLRQSREEHEQMVHEALMKKTKEWENEKLELETQIIELQAKLEVKAETASSIDHQVSLKLKDLEKEKYSLQIELLAKTEYLHLRTLERDLSTQAAETASKQHLESIKKVAKLEAECRRFKAASRKSSQLNNDQKPVPSSVCVESLTDSQSDSGERLITLDNEPSCSDSWASALIAELDQFKNDKATTINLTSSTTEIDLMDDFLEMERLAALPESSSFDIGGDSDLSVTRDGPSRAEVEIMRRQLAELEQKIAKFETEKVEMEMALSEARNQLKDSSDRLIIADNKLIELQLELSAANGSKHIFDAQMEAVDAKRKELESQLNEKVSLLEGKVDEKTLSEKLESKLQEIESVEAERKGLAFQLEMTQLEFRKLHERVGFLEREIDEERKLSSEYSASCQNMEIINTKSREVEAQFNELHIKVHTLEDRLKEEEAISAKLTANIEDIEANRKKLSTQLESANMKSVKLKERITLLEQELEQERELSAELAAKCQHSQSQLSSAHFEIRKLYEKVRSLERIVDEERSSSTEFKAQAEASMEAKKNALEAQIRSAQFEVEDLHKKASVLERKVEEERAISAGLAANLEGTLLASREELERLQGKVSSLNQEVDKEKSMFAQLAAQYRSLEDELTTKKQEDELPGSMTSDAVLMLKKEKDIVMASEKFAACQKTINSISQQLKSLSNFENLMVEPEMPDCDINSLHLTAVGVKDLQSDYSLENFGDC